MRAIASLVIVAMLVSGCGPTWPAAVSATGSASHEIRTIDVLPLDLALWTEANYDAAPEQLRSTAEMNLMNATLAGLTSRSYTVASTIDWNGDYSGGNALPRDALGATLASLSRYTARPTPQRGQLPPPYMPVRLGTATGADATLYVGGWAYVAAPHESTANEVAKDVLIGIVVIVAFVAIAALLAGAHGHGGGGGGGHGGGGGGHGGGGGGHASLASSRLRLGGGGGGGASAVGTGVRVAANVAARTAIDAVDVFGRTAVIDNRHADWETDEELPRHGDSRMFLEMTLVDNQTGLALWHAHQIMPANAASKGDLERAARDVLASLPRS